MTLADLILIHIRGVGSRTVAHLVNIFGSADAVLSASVDELIERAELRPDVAKLILSADVRVMASQQMEYCHRNNIEMLAATDASYPELLRETPDRPHVLFVQGNIDALSGHTLAMVGTREMTPSGATVCNRLVEGLCQSVDDLCIVSGLAYGVDAASHRAALTYGATTVAVLASVLPNVSPAPHRALANEIIAKGGAIVSELHTNTRQNGTYFVARNRIIAGMSCGTLVVESPASGGSLITADIADSYGRTVMAAPGRLTDVASVGTNNLIRSGKARLVLTASDIIDDLGWNSSLRVARHGQNISPCSRVDELSERHRLVYDIIAASTTTSFVELLNRSQLSIGELSMVVMDLELHGVIRSLPGQRYEII